MLEDAEKKGLISPGKVRYTVLNVIFRKLFGESEFSPTEFT